MQPKENREAVIFIEKMLDEAHRGKHKKVMDFLKEENLMYHALSLSDYYLNYESVLESLLMERIFLELIVQRCIGGNDIDVSSSALRSDFVSIITSSKFQKQWYLKNDYDFNAELYAILKKKGLRIAFAKMLFKYRKNIEKEFFADVFFHTNGIPTRSEYAIFLVRSAYWKIRDIEDVQKLFWEGFDFGGSYAIEQHRAFMDALFFHQKIKFFELVVKDEDTQIPLINTLTDYLYPLVKENKQQYPLFLTALENINNHYKEEIFDLVKYPFVNINQKTLELA